MAFTQPPGEAEGDPANDVVLYLYLEFLAHGLEYSLGSSIALLHDLHGPVLLHSRPPFPVCRHHITPRGDAGPIASCRRSYPVLCYPNPR
jgi:hypothetical protein